MFLEYTMFPLYIILNILTFNFMILCLNRLVVHNIDFNRIILLLYVIILYIKLYYKFRITAGKFLICYFRHF